MLDTPTQLTAADPALSVVPVILSEHHQDLESFGERVTSVHRQLVDEPQVGVYHAVQELGRTRGGAAAPRPEKDPGAPKPAPLQENPVALSFHLCTARGRLVTATIVREASDVSRQIAFSRLSGVNETPITPLSRLNADGGWEVSGAGGGRW